LTNINEQECFGIKKPLAERIKFTVLCKELYLALHVPVVHRNLKSKSGLFLGVCIAIKFDVKGGSFLLF
jgi:hypothetical protein